MKIYVASSWRNEQQPGIVETLRAAGHDVYDFRNPPGKSGFAWREVRPGGIPGPPELLEALRHPRAREGFESDMGALRAADAVVLLLPCGRSAHLEAGFAVGAGKPCFVVLHEDKFEPELMYLMAAKILPSAAGLVEALTQHFCEHDWEFGEERARQRKSTCRLCGVRGPTSVRPAPTPRCSIVGCALPGIWLGPGGQPICDNHRHILAGGGTA